MTLCAKDLMSKAVITARPEMSCQEVMELFIVNKISGAPVVNLEGVLIGVISQSDILSVGLDMPYRYNYFEEISLSNALEREGFHLENITGGFVSDYMNRHVFTVLPTTSIEAVAKLMLENKIHRVIVINPDEQKPVGVISTFDLLKIMAGASLVGEHKCCC